MQRPTTIFGELRTFDCSAKINTSHDVYTYLDMLHPGINTDNYLHTFSSYLTNGFISFFYK